MKPKRKIVADESFRSDELLDKECIDFLPNINPHSSVDIDIMKSWQLHFERQGIPYYVVRLSDNRLSLYKEMRCKYVQF